MNQFPKACPLLNSSVFLITPQVYTVKSQVGGTSPELYAKIKAFQVYPCWEHLGGPEKNQVLCFEGLSCIYILSLHVFFSPAECLWALSRLIWHG